MISFFIGLFFIAVIFSYAYASWQTAPWVPTFKDDVSRFLTLAAIKPGQKVYDLGSGDGRIVYAAAKNGAMAEGFEISLLPYFISLSQSIFQKTHRVKITFRDFWLEDLSDADIIYVYLMQKIYPKLKLKLERELKRGTKVISYAWPINGWEPIIINSAERQPTIYVYIIQ